MAFFSDDGDLHLDDNLFEFWGALCDENELDAFIGTGSPGEIQGSNGNNGNNGSGNHGSSVSNSSSGHSGSSGSLNAFNHGNNSLIGAPSNSNNSDNTINVDTSHCDSDNSGDNAGNSSSNATERSGHIPPNSVSSAGSGSSNSSSGSSQASSSKNIPAISLGNLHHLSGLPNAPPVVSVIEGDSKIYENSGNGNHRINGNLGKTVRSDDGKPDRVGSIDTSKAGIYSQNWRKGGEGDIKVFIQCIMMLYCRLLLLL